MGASMLPMIEQKAGVLRGLAGECWALMVLCGVSGTVCVSVSRCVLWRRVNLFGGKADHLLFIIKRVSVYWIAWVSVCQCHSVGQWSSGCWGARDVHVLHEHCSVTACLDPCHLLSDGKLGY